jgi:DegV family protein with EDD domain
MPKICIVTDSTADISKEVTEQLGIYVVPLKVHINNESYLDGVTISPAEFYEMLVKSEKFPSTSQPSPADFETIYKQIAAEHGNDVEIISIHLSSALSGTFQSANIARTMVESDLQVTVIDSKKAAYLLGMIVVQAARARNEGKSKDECIELVTQMIRGQKDYFVVDTLTYLQKGGRIGKAQALIGSILNVKPILSLNENGEVYPFDKVRGKKKAIARILDELKQYAKDDKVLISLLYATNLEEVEDLRKAISEQFNVGEVAVAEIGPVIGAHVGPNALAVSMYKM